MNRGQILYPHGCSNTRGVAILFKHGSNFNINKIDRDESGCMLIVDVKIKEVSITTCNVYAPNDDCPEFLVKLASMLDEFNNLHKIIAQVIITLKRKMYLKLLWKKIIWWICGG